MEDSPDPSVDISSKVLLSEEKISSSVDVEDSSGPREIGFEDRLHAYSEPDLLTDFADLLQKSLLIVVREPWNWKHSHFHLERRASVAFKTLRGARLKHKLNLIFSLILMQKNLRIEALIMVGRMKLYICT
uniref:Uncharacterized protein n=1 Tax=Cucumis melo TaxID=3656 RepID=A0A9I9EKE1_CUCME